MTSLGLIQRIARLAIRNFSRDQPKMDIVGNEYDQMKKLVNMITIEDLNIDPTLLEDRGPYNPQRESAPVTYMQIYEDTDVTICLFILKNGVKLPLHDHPNMTGILKVIHGSVSVQSYTMKQQPSHFEGEQSNKKPFPGIYPAVKHPCIKVTSSDPACLVTPDSHNLHEISSVGGLAAFLDILSPPYGFDQRNGIERDCHYYEEIDVPLKNDVLPNDSVFLISVPTPLEFWCDQAEYNGPPLPSRETVVNGQSNS